MPSTTEVMTEAAAKEHVARLASEAEKVIQAATIVAQIDSPEAEKRAAEFRAQMKIRIKKSEDARTFLVGPLNAHIKKINAEFKSATEPMEQADKIVADGMIRWRNSEMVIAAKEAAAQAAREASAAVRHGDLETMQERAQEHAVAAAVAPKAVQTQSGKLTYRKTWRWEIEDMEKIPAAYWTVDEKKVAAAVKAGISIQGVKAWIEETPVMGS